MISELDSFKRFCEESNGIIKRHDDHIKLLYELDRLLEDILNAASMYGTPEYKHDSAHAIMMSIMATVKANRMHHISLRALLQSMDKHIKSLHLQ